MSRVQGIETRHRAGCPAGAKAEIRGACACQPSYRAVVRGSGGTKVARTFHRRRDAEKWRALALADVIRNPRLASKSPTISAASDAFLAAMETGAARTRSGDTYKPSVIRAYRDSMRKFIIPEIGSMKLDRVELRDVQRIAESMLAAGQSPSSVQNAFMPVRVLYRRAARDGTASTNPCKHLDLPAVRGRRERIASPEEAQGLLAVLSTFDRAWWGLAFYAGLRRGEIRGLRWEHVDLGAGLIRVEDGWDQFAGRIDPKSIAGRRQVIIVAALRDALTEHAHASGTSGFVFPGSKAKVTDPSGLLKRVRKAWKEAELDPIGMHEARHTCASFFIAAGVNAKALSEMMGHSSITVTFDVYGHLMPGSRDEARELVDAYLERAVR